MKTVELKTAYHWHCDECSSENFALPMKVEMTPEDREFQFREFHSMGPWEELPEGWEQFEVVCIPERVVCSECSTEFRTKDERDY